MFHKKTAYEKVLRKLTPTDVGLIKLSMIALGLFVATYFPKLIEIDPMIYLFLFIIFAIKPMMLWLK